MKVIKPVAMCRYLQSLGMYRRRLVGLDVGDECIGCAISDYNLLRAEPLRIMDRREGFEVVKTDFKKIISRYNISGLIVGFPTNKLSKTSASEMIETFVDDLDKTGDFPDVNVCYWDEFGTTQIAKLFLQQLKLTRKETKEIGDKMAAVGILQGYLDFFNNPGSKPWKGVM